jgi:hypothetical protein
MKTNFKTNKSISLESILNSMNTYQDIYMVEIEFKDTVYSVSEYSNIVNRVDNTTLKVHSNVLNRAINKRRLSSIIKRILVLEDEINYIRLWEAEYNNSALTIDIYDDGYELITSFSGFKYYISGIDVRYEGAFNGFLEQSFIPRDLFVIEDVLNMVLTSSLCPDCTIREYVDKYRLGQRVPRIIYNALREV